MRLTNRHIQSVNSSVARSFNSATVLKLIYQNQPISRVQLAEITGLNKSTVSSIVSELLHENMIEEHENQDQKIGRNPINLSLKAGINFFGAINIDSVYTRFAIVDLDGSVKNLASIKTNAQNAEEFITSCVAELKVLASKSNVPRLTGIGVSVSGIVNFEKKTVKYAPNLGWENINVGEIITKAAPEIEYVLVGNDAKVSALAEFWFGKHKIDLSNFVFVSVGPGIGSGIIIENKLIDGKFSAAGEFGHMTIIDQGIKCSCNNFGCWEAYASDKATEKRYADEAGLSEPIDFEEILKLAMHGDDTAIKVLRKTAYYLGIGIVNIIKAVDPKAIVIGGKITSAWEIIYDEILKVIQQRAFFRNPKDVKILPTSLKMRPRVLGAAALVIRDVLDNY